VLILQNISWQILGIKGIKRKRFLIKKDYIIILLKKAIVLI